MTDLALVVSLYVLAPSVLVMALVIMAKYRARSGRFPHVFMMSLSYIGLVVTTVCAVSQVVPDVWVVVGTFVSLMVGIKGLLLIGVTAAIGSKSMRWWPEREVVRWAAKRIMRHG